MALKSADDKRTIKPENLFEDRARTNILKKGEQRLIRYLLEKVPPFITPNKMTIVGFIGSIIVFSAFILAIYYGRIYLSIGLLGLMVNWIGDSLDGRLAYYRQIQRKWYGFALDIMMDWLSIILIGLGYYFYAPIYSKVLGFLFVVFYGWSMIISLLRYKIAGIYNIDSGKLGPTELRVIIAFILLFEIILPGSITYLAAIVTLLLLFINIKDSINLLNLGDRKDEEEKRQ
ncbi:CDP-alcohol phosphatidyltransferase family protein [Pedobacter mucosus]|uniref:CDP-alcohol phosphatidyltransferase family protein n=1 Tax=Pedobacter mucosus TaxID=2895286 RepID=UPI001EE3D3DD|nr:CDP-alcohol phosphatidyltransferase family protein [Pedobacter mucosus]UKT63957.1 CDP-alcohol phosphatidyltransferase family protein [Pedobacter mucosus]